MQRIRNILSCLSREDLLYGFPHSASLQTLTDQQIEIIADACAPSRQALAELSGDLLIFRLARSLAEHCPFQTTDGKNTGLVNLRAFLFLTLYIVAKNGHILSGRCPYGGKRCKDGISCARAAVRYFSQRPVFKSDDKAQETLALITEWHHKDFLVFAETVIGTDKRCQRFQETLIDP